VEASVVANERCRVQRMGIPVQLGESTTAQRLDHGPYAFFSELRIVESIPQLVRIGIHEGNRHDPRLGKQREQEVRGYAEIGSYFEDTAWFHVQTSGCERFVVAQVRHVSRSLCCAGRFPLSPGAFLVIK